MKTSLAGTKENKRKQVTIMVPLDLWKRMKLRAVAEGIPLCDMVAQFLTAGLRKKGAADV